MEPAAGVLSVSPTEFRRLAATPGEAQECSKILRNMWYSPEDLVRAAALFLGPLECEPYSFPKRGHVVGYFPEVHQLDGSSPELDAGAIEMVLEDGAQVPVSKTAPAWWPIRSGDFRGMKGDRGWVGAPSNWKGTCFVNGPHGRRSGARIGEKEVVPVMDPATWWVPLCAAHGQRHGVAAVAPLDCGFYTRVAQGCDVWLMSDKRPQYGSPAPSLINSSSARGPTALYLWIPPRLRVHGPRGWPRDPRSGRWHRKTCAATRSGERITVGSTSFTVFFGRGDR